MPCKNKIFTIVLFVILIFYSGQRVCYPQEGKVNEMLDNLHWLGHASFRLDSSKVIYFDPWKLTKSPKGADIILITHEHFDHYSVNDIKLINTKDTVVVTNKEVARKLNSAKITCKEIRPLSTGENIDIAGVKIRAVASYNTNKQFHTKESGKLGFIVTAEGVKIYHAGDTDFIPEMNDYDCDIALLPVSGAYVMTAAEAAKACLIINPRIAIPMHYGDIIGQVSDAIQFQDLLKGKVEVKILQKED